MSGLGTRLAGLFLAPAEKPSAAPTAEQAAPEAVRGPQIVAVVASLADLDAAAGAIAATLRRDASRRTAVVCRPTAEEAAVGEPGTLAAPPAHLATPAAARLARKLAARDLPAAPAGAVCRVALSCEAGPAARDLWRVAGAVDVPIVLALPGRLEGFDEVLAQLDRLVLAAPVEVDAALCALARESLAALGPPSTRAVPPSGVLTRRLAAAGLVAMPLDAAVADTADGPPSPDPASRLQSEATFEPPRAEVRA